MAVLGPSIEVVSSIAPLPITTIRNVYLDSWNSCSMISDLDKVVVFSSDVDCCNVVREVPNGADKDFKLDKL